MSESSNESACSSTSPNSNIASTRSNPKIRSITRTQSPASSNEGSRTTASGYSMSSEETLKQVHSRSTTPQKTMIEIAKELFEDPVTLSGSNSLSTSRSINLKEYQPQGVSTSRSINLKEYQPQGVGVSTSRSINLKEYPKGREQ